jgi:hypothetical protein
MRPLPGFWLGFRVALSAPGIGIDIPPCRRGAGMGIGICMGRGAVSGTAWSPVGSGIDCDGGGTEAAGRLACARTPPAGPTAASSAAIVILPINQHRVIKQSRGISGRSPILAPTGLYGIGGCVPQPLSNDGDRSKLDVRLTLDDPVMLIKETLTANERLDASGSLLKQVEDRFTVVDQAPGSVHRVDEV